VIVYIVTSSQLICEGVFSTQYLAEARIRWLKSKYPDITAHYDAETVDIDVTDLTDLTESEIEETIAGLADYSD
jgi:hypothetical protein